MLFYPNTPELLFLYLYRHEVRRPWRAVVVYPERATETSPGPAHAPLERTGLLHKIYLRDLIDGPAESPGVRIARMVVLDDAQTAAEARDLVAATREQPEHETLVDLIETILVYKFPKLSRDEIKAMLHLPDTELKQTRFYQEVFAEGVEEGIEKGIEKGQLNVLLRQLSYRLGPIDATRTDRIRTLPSGTRDTLAEALFDFTSAADLDAWLDAHAPRP